MTNFSKFLDDETGAVTIDWVALTAGILLLGIMVVYAIFNGGVAGLVADINATLTGVATDVDTGSTPSLNGTTVPVSDLFTEAESNMNDLVSDFEEFVESEGEFTEPEGEE